MRIALDTLSRGDDISFHGCSIPSSRCLGRACGRRRCCSDDAAVCRLPRLGRWRAADYAGAKAGAHDVGVRVACRRACVADRGMHRLYAFATRTRRSASPRLRGSRWLSDASLVRASAALRRRRLLGCCLAAIRRSRRATAMQSSLRTSTRCRAGSVTLATRSIASSLPTCPRCAKPCAGTHRSMDRAAVAGLSRSTA